MKKRFQFIIVIIIIILFNYPIIPLNAQSLSPQVISSSGAYQSNTNGSLSFTIGETVTQTLTSATIMLTQGFQQPYTIDSTLLYLVLYLEGYYSGGYTMQPVLLNQGQSLNTNITDTITVELRPAATPSVIAAQVKTLLYTNALANCIIPVSNGSYYIVVKHRNTIETWTANPVSFTGSFVGYDFSYSANQAYGSNQVEVQPGVWAMYSGDLNADENVDLLDIGLLETDINAFQFGYFATDINGDGNVDLLDAPTVEANVNGFVFSNHP